MAAVGNARPNSKNKQTTKEGESEETCSYEGKGGRTALVGDGIGFRRSELLRYLTLEVLLLLLDHHELFSQRDDRVTRGLLGIAPAGKVAHE